jgi:hypothetical protein
MVSALHSFASNPHCIAILLQEPASEQSKLPPAHPEFDLLTPMSDKLLYATYVRHLPGIQSDITFMYSNSFLGTLISFPNSPSLTIYNFYSPSRPNVIANRLPTFQPSLPAIVMGDRNAHDPWWGSSEGLDDPLIRIHRTYTNIIMDWMDNNNFRLHNKPGYLMHFLSRSVLSHTDKWQAT